MHAPLLGVILHAYVEYTEVINNIDAIIVTLPVCVCMYLCTYVLMYVCIYMYECM